MARTLLEEIYDRLLLLWLIYDAMNYKFFGETKVQKLTFLAEWEMLDKREKGFNYNFIKLTFGPYSKDLEKDIKWLEDSNFVKIVPVDEKTRIFKPTELGQKILATFHDAFDRNRIFIEKIAEINRKFASLTLDELLKFVYGLPHPYMKGKPRTIGELKPGTILLYRMDPKKARVSFYLTPQEVATLDIYLDKECYHSLMDACESAKRKRLLTFNEVF
jgi:uncharacterized protein YwgA